MNLFSIFKKRKKQSVELKPAAILKLVLDSFTATHHSSQYFIESKALLDRNEWSLALEILIEVAD